jgi:type I restriction enzyme S subunit
LSRVDSCRERLDRVPAILRRFRQSVLAAATSGKLTEEWRNASKSETSWEDVTLADVATEFSYGSSAKSSKVGRIPVLRMGNIQDGQLDWKDLVYTSNKEEIEKYRLEPGDILFNRTNSPELVGKTAVYDGNQPAIYAGYLIKVRCSDRVLPEYLNYCLNSPAGKDYCWKVKSDGVSQSNINAKKLAAFPFLLPPLEEQMQIVQQVEALYARASLISNHHSAAASRLEQLQKSSLAKAFRGDLVPQDPNDEPAAELLERIRELKGKETDESKKKGRSRMTRTTRKSNGQIRQLTLVLQENNGVMTPEKLLDAAGYTDESIEDFYLTLRQCIADGAIQDPRDHDNQIVLVQAQT